MMLSVRKGPLPLFLILVLALVLRLWGITWGLPSETHYFSYHPDESVVLGAAMHMDLLHGQLLPHFYNYGSLQLYLVNFANTLAFLFGAVNIVIRDLATDHGQWARMYLIGRLVTVAMGVGTVDAVYGIGKMLWGRRAGLLAALLLAILPLHAQHSHWLTVDVPATFWGTLALWAVVQISSRSERDDQSGPPSRKSLRWAILAGLFAGFACATKYNMALMLLPLLTAGIFAARRQTALGVKLIGAGLAALAFAFLIGCPGSVLENGKFLQDVQFEANHVSHQPGATFADTGSGFIYHILHSLDPGMGLPLLLLSLASVLYALHRRQRGDGLLAAFALPYFLLIGLAAVRYARYAIPLLPVLALWAGRLLAEGSRASKPAWRMLSASCAVIVVLFTLADCLWLLQPMAQPDPRDQALNWINAHGYKSAAIGFAAMPWFQTPPVSPYFSAPLRGSWRTVTPEQDAARLLYHGKDWDRTILDQDKPPIILLSEYDDDDALRLQDPAALQFLGELHRIYTVAAVYDSRKNLLGAGEARLPHDMLYPSPTTWIYVRK